MKLHGLEFPDDLLYAPDYNLWLREEPDGAVTLGLSAYGCALYGQIFAFTPKRDGWRIDFLRTYDCGDPEKEALYRFEAGVLPLIATAMKELSEKLNDFASFADLKKELDARTEASYSGTKRKESARPHQ